MHGNLFDERFSEQSAFLVRNTLTHGVSREEIAWDLHKEARLQRFHNCCTPKPPPSSGIFLEKTPPRTMPERADGLWNRSKQARSRLD
jgi:hypothetical protein